MKDNRNTLMSKHDLSCSIADHGMWEEFHQKRGNYYMYDFHKRRRLELQNDYDNGRYKSS